MSKSAVPMTEELKLLLDKFQAWLYLNVPLKNSTATMYLGFIRRAFPFTGATPTPEKIGEYIVSLRRANMANNSVCATITAMERFGDFLGTPIHIARPPKVKKSIPQTMSEAEVAVFIHHAKNLRERAILAVLAYTGMRNKELCNLRVRDVDLSSNLIHIEIGKFSKERKVHMPGECASILVEYMKGRNQSTDDLLFVTTRHGYELEQQDIRKLIRTITKRANFNRRIWPHLFRHSLATNLLERGANILTIRDQLGHTYIESSMNYVHASGKRHQSDYNQHVPSYT